MKNPVAIITGAGKGTGRETARLLSATHRLALVARTEADLAETAGLCGPDTFTIPADVSDPAAATLAVARTLENFGRLDALVNCAGFAPMLSIEETSIEEWRRILDTNLSSVFYFCKSCWPAFKAQGAGVVVNVSSESARDPFAGLAAYGAAKAGLNLLGRAWAKEGVPLGIRVHTIAPGAVETGMLRQLVTPEQLSAEKTLNPADVARVIVDCIAGALQYTSGEVIWLHKTL